MAIFPIREIEGKVSKDQDVHRQLLLEHQFHVVHQKYLHRNPCHHHTLAVCNL